MLKQAYCLQKILALPFGPDSAEVGNAHSSNGPYYASRLCSIPKPAREAAVTDANARKIQKERKRGREPVRGEKRREARLEDRNLTSFPAFRPAFIPAGTKTASPSPAQLSSACPPLKTPANTHA